MVENFEGQADLSIVGVSKTYRDQRGREVKALQNVSLEIASGEFIVLLGPSGCGKTTLLRSIAGFEEIDSGFISLGGKKIDHLAPNIRPVNTVFQSYALFPHMSVLDNVEYGLKVKKIGKEERRTRAMKALERVKLNGYESRKPSQLSGGQRQRVALARALVNEPKVLLLDEPLGALDLKLRHEMQVELKELQRDIGITFIFVTHDQEEALTMADRIAVFNAGNIVQMGSPREIYEEPNSEFVAGFVGISNLIHRDGKVLSIRPEKIKLGKHFDRTSSGSVATVMFLGAITRVDVHVGSDSLSLLVENDGINYLPQVGDSVEISWDSKYESQVG